MPPCLLSSFGYRFLTEVNGRFLSGYPSPTSLVNFSAILDLILGVLLFPFDSQFFPPPDLLLHWLYFPLRATNTTAPLKQYQQESIFVPVCNLPSTSHACVHTLRNGPHNKSGPHRLTSRPLQPCLWDMPMCLYFWILGWNPRIHLAQNAQKWRFDDPFIIPILPWMKSTFVWKIEFAPKMYHFAGWIQCTLMLLYHLYVSGPYSLSFSWYSLSLNS